MKPFTLALALFMLLNFTSFAQDTQPLPEESSAVRATVTDYIEAYYTGDAERMQHTLHPHYLKHMIHGDIAMREKTGVQMVQEVRKNGPADLPAANKTEQIVVLDVVGNIASAKLVTPGWVDYMTLEKTTGQWKILSVVQSIHD